MTVGGYFGTLRYKWNTGDVVLKGLNLLFQNLELLTGTDSHTSGDSVNRVNPGRYSTHTRLHPTPYV